MNDSLKPWNSTEPAEKYNELFPVFYNYSAFDVLGDVPKIGISRSVSADLKRKLVTAIISGKLGIGLSYAEKKYSSDFEISPSRDPGLSYEIENLFEYGHSRLDSYVAALTDAVAPDSKSLDDLSNQFFYRNLGGLFAAKHLSELGYLCESAVVLRSVIEQFAFSAKLRTLPPETDLSQIRPVQCLNYLKSIESSSGRLYGLLSRYTHFEYDHHTHFLSALQKKYKQFRKIVRFALTRPT
jgi:hypothetical protein